MLSIHDIAAKQGKKLANLTEQHENHEIYSYGLEFVLGGLLKVLILTILAVAFGILRLTIAVVITTFLYRLLSGGAHCNAYNRCLVVSIASFLILAYSAKLFWVSAISPQSVFFAILAFALFVAIRYAPQAPGNKPIGELNRFLLLKTLSVGFVIVWFATISYLPADMALASAFGLLWQSISLTPIGQGFFSSLDGMLAKIFFWGGGDIYENSI